MPKDDLILTIDIGSSSCKSVLFREDGSIVAGAANPYHSYYPQPGWVEQEPADWWAATVSSVREILQRSEVNGSRVAAISVTGQMHGIVSVGADGTALRPCLTLHDQRAANEASQICADMGLSQIYDLTGARLTASMPLAKISWFRQQEGDLHRKACFYLSCKDYVKHQLTGNTSTDPIEAAGTLLHDIRTGDWSEPLLDACGISADMLPPVRSPWEVDGPLTAHAARQLGLPAGIPVLVGAGDDVEFLGMGLIEPGMSLEHFGTTGSIMTCVDRPVYDPSLAVELYPHLDPSLWLLGGSVNNAGGALSWASRTLYGDNEKQVSDILGQGRLQTDLENPLLFLPQLSGERCPIWNAQARGGWVGLSVEHNRDDLFRAAAEGAVFSLRHVMDRIEELAVPVTSIAVGNGSIDSMPWLCLRASIYNRELHLVAVSEPTSLGAMIVAGVGLGLFEDIKAGVKQVESIQDRVLPDADLAPACSRLYELYKQAVERNAPLFDLMATASEVDWA